MSTTRRSLMLGSGALAGLAIVPLVAEARAPDSDAELIRLCQQAEVAHHKHIATGEVWSHLPMWKPEGIAAEAEYVDAGDDLDQKISALCAYVPAALEGHAAMARLALTIMEPYRPINDEDQDRALTYVPDPLIEQILLNLAGGLA